VRRGLGIDPHASAVDSHVVVPPAAGGEVLGRVITASGSFEDVVNLQPVGGTAPVDGASFVAGEDSPPQTGPDSRGGSVMGDVLSGHRDALDVARTLDEVHGSGTYAASCQDGDASLEARRFGDGIVGYDHEQGLAPVTRRWGTGRDHRRDLGVLVQFVLT